MATTPCAVRGRAHVSHDRRWAVAEGVVTSGGGVAAADGACAGRCRRQLNFHVPSAATRRRRETSLARASRVPGIPRDGTLRSHLTHLADADKNAGPSSRPPQSGLRCHGRNWRPMQQDARKTEPPTLEAPWTWNW